MTEVSTQIKRLRTFSDDVANAKGSSSVPEKPVVKTPVERLPLTKGVPKITLMPPVNAKPPVITKPKPEPIVIKEVASVVTPPPTPKPPTVTPLSTSALKTEPPKAATPTPTIIPKASELQKEISQINKKQPSSILTTDNNGLNVSDKGSSDGSIVTDRKKDNFNVFSASWGAIGGWVDEKLRILEPDQSNFPKVRTIESRRDVITKAASQSALAPKDDHGKVTPVKPAPTTEQTSSSSPVITIKKAEAVPPTSWSHFKGEEGPAIPEKKTTEVQVAPKVVEQVVAKVEPAKEPEVQAEIKPVPTIPPVKEDVLPQEKRAIEFKPLEIKLPEKVVEQPIPELVSVPAYTPQVDTKDIPEVDTPAEPLPSAPISTKKDSVQFAPARPSPFPIIRVSIIAMTSIIFGVSLALWLFGGGSEPNQPIAGEAETVALISPDQKIDVPVNNNKSSLLQSLTDTSVPSGSSVTLLEPKMNLNGNSTVPPANTIIQILNPRWPGSFTRAVEAINFGKYNGKSFIVMKVTSFDSGFSGLLSSESSLILDFEPLFGKPVLGTFDLSARTAGNIVDPYFVDSSVKNHDVRILRDELQKERLVYGFVNRNTIVITIDSTTFEAVADKIK